MEDRLFVKGKPKMTRSRVPPAQPDPPPQGAAQGFIWLVASAFIALAVEYAWRDDNLPSAVLPGIVGVAIFFLGIFWPRIAKAVPLKFSQRASSAATDARTWAAATAVIFIGIALLPIFDHFKQIGALQLQLSTLEGKRARLQGQEDYHLLLLKRIYNGDFITAPLGSRYAGKVVVTVPLSETMSQHRNGPCGNFENMANVTIKNGSCENHETGFQAKSGGRLTIDNVTTK
jgi:hypothetical protein